MPQLQERLPKVMVVSHIHDPIVFRVEATGVTHMVDEPEDMGVYLESWPLGAYGSCGVGLECEGIMARQRFSTPIDCTGCRRVHAERLQRSID